MRTGRFGVLLAVASLLVPNSLEATCGGGGGGGRGGAGGSGTPAPVYRTTWVGSPDAATRRATGDQTGYVLYFLPEGESTDHPFFASKPAADLSQKYAFVRLPYRADDPLREWYPAETKRHSIHVCDAFGNSMRSFAVNSRSRISASRIEGPLKSAANFAAQAQRRLESDLKRAEPLAAGDDPRRAIRYLAKILAFRGYPVVARAQELMEPVVEAGLARIEEALALESESARRSELRRVRNEFRNCKPIEERCDEELGRLTGSLGPDLRDDEALAAASQLVEEVMAALLPETDDVLPFTLGERVHQALEQGIARETAGDYVGALEAYAMACGLDPFDPVPLVYLGETYRHHLGEWERAHAVFQRALELDSDDFASAIALHGIGKMTIWAGDDARGLQFFERSIQRYPTALCYRNLAVYWNTENDPARAHEYATLAIEIDPEDPYNQVFYSVFELLDGQPENAARRIDSVPHDPSMSYNLACYHALRGERNLALDFLRRHFHEYERFDRVRRFEMAEARMDANFSSLMADEGFLELTAAGVQALEEGSSWSATPGGR